MLPLVRGVRPDRDSLHVTLLDHLYATHAVKHHWNGSLPGDRLSRATGRLPQALLDYRQSMSSGLSSR
ncbi:hypothetical protein OH77DRAFT_1425194 [Trametes cingulata]|nr:hypothetical protein OH77DRAFT_1425194 [Trametes cingulata]